MKRATLAAAGGRSVLRPARGMGRRLLKFLPVAVAAGGLFWLISIHASALRDPRFLDGWVLTAGMAAQLYLHISNTFARQPKAAPHRRTLHSLTGLFLIAAFLSHCGFSLPETGFEWGLWTAFALVSLSGILGIAIAGAMTGATGHEPTERISARTAELAEELRQAVSTCDTDPMTAALPPSPDDAWIMDLYKNTLKSAFETPRGSIGLLVFPQRQLLRLTAEIDGLSHYAGTPAQTKLANIKRLVAEKHALDRSHVLGKLSRGWLYVHVPATYALIVLTVLHILVAYAFSSRTW